MDILTERGQRYVEEERRVVAYMQDLYRTSFVYHTPLHTPAALDIVSIRDGQVRSVAEIKCRENTIDDFLRFGSLILTWSKVEAMQDVADALYVPGYVVLYSIPDDAICVAHIVNPDGTLAAKIDCDITATKRSCNGGQAMRKNGYIPINLFGDFEPHFF